MFIWDNVSNKELGVVSPGRTPERKAGMRALMFGVVALADSGLSEPVRTLVERFGFRGKSVPDG